MTLSEYIAYFKTTAINHKDIAHVDNTHESFIKVNVQEVLSRLRTSIKYPCLAIELPEIDTSDALSDNVRDLISGAIIVLKPANLTDYADQIQAQSDCLEIAKDIRSKIVNDRRKLVLKGIDQNSFKLLEVGPVYSNLFGYRLEFVFNEPTSTRLDESKWNNETKWTL